MEARVSLKPVPRNGIRAPALYCKCRILNPLSRPIRCWQKKQALVDVQLQLSKNAAAECSPACINDLKRVSDYGSKHGSQIQADGLVKIPTELKSRDYWLVFLTTTFCCQKSWPLLKAAPSSWNPMRSNESPIRYKAV